MDKNHLCMQKQIKRAVEEMPGTAVRSATVDHLLEAHGCYMKLVTRRPVDCDRDGVECSHKA